MKEEKSATRLRHRLALATIAAAILAGEVMQFILFSQFASDEVEAAGHALSNGVSQAFSREFQRYAALAASLREMAGANKAGVNGARSGLELIMASYGPSGKEAALITAAGYIRTSATGTAAPLDSSGAWQDKLFHFPMPLTEDAQALLASGKVLCYYDQNRMSSQVLLAQAGPGVVAFAELDMDDFLKRYIEPSLASEYPGISIAYASAAVQGWDKKKQETGRPSRSRPGFNPVATLLGIGTSAREEVKVQVPSRLDEYLSHNVLPFDAKFSGDSPSNRSAAGSDDHYANWRRTRAVSISAGVKSAIAATELRLSLNWLIMALFLAGIGIALAAALAEKNKLVELSIREREFVASVTHEFRTPVTAIRTAADNMRKGLVGPERTVPYGDMIHTQALRLGSMVEEILLFSQVEGRKRASPNLAELWTADFLAQLRPALDEIAASSKILIDWDFGSLPENFMTDGDSLQTIVSNIVANAIYHAYPGPGKGQVRVIGRIRLATALQIIVEDDGRGISKAESKLVFDPFYRDSESRKRQEKGTGLGLFIARRKAEMIGGSVALESPYRRIDGVKRSGCRFMIEVPYKESEHAR